jgi:hypothetical protein
VPVVITSGTTLILRARTTRSSIRLRDNDILRLICRPAR